MTYFIPVTNNSLFHRSSSCISFLMSLIRCGDQLDDKEELMIQRLLHDLQEKELELSNEDAKN